MVEVIKEICYVSCYDFRPHRMHAVHRCGLLLQMLRDLDVCLLDTNVNPNDSRLGSYTLRWANHVLGVGRDSLPEEGAIFGGGIFRPTVKYRKKFRHEPKLFSMWQQLCGILLSVLQQLYFFFDHFSSPSNAIGPLCESVCADDNFRTN